jgi:GntR family transcriptional repressor for pyruvate dehydrogenase complex
MSSSESSQGHAYGPFTKGILPEMIADRILSMISERKLKAGDRLPPERELAATMGVSRPSLREALRALAMMNVIDIRQGAGTFVTSLEPGLLVEHLEFVFQLSDATYLQLLQARKALEPAIAAVAAARITDEEIAALDRCLVRSREYAGMHEAFLEADLDLHEIVIAASGNPILERLMASISRLGRASRQRTQLIPGVVATTLEDHREIVEALRRHDPQGAAEAMLKHIVHIERKLMEFTAPDYAQPSREVDGDERAGWDGDRGSAVHGRLS